MNNFMRKIKFIFWGFVVVAILGIVGFLNLEFIQKKAYDIKADAVGSNRSITFYSTMEAKPVATYTDKDMRFETENTGTVSVWLGSQNKKVKSNMQYIVEDLK